MSEYEFIFVLDGISIDDHDAVQLLTEELDALVSCSHGVHRMTVVGEGPDAVTAAKSVVTRALGLVPTMRIVRLDRDLVGVSDIAERTERTRQNVTQWVRGQRQRQDGVPFPAPEGTVGHSLVWLWSEVNDWLRGIGLDDGEQRPTRAETTEIDWRLQTLKAVRLNLIEGSDRADVHRVAEQLAEHARTNPRFTDYLARNPQVRESDGRYTILVCSPKDEAVEVFRRLESFTHPVVLATVTTDIHALVMTPGSGDKQNTSELDRGMTVRDWLELITMFPDREFTVSAEDSGPATIAAKSPLDLVSS
ncbi:hypothetical protein HDA32_001128 [Spinactinospora alkalitolerans]|uniref:Uncharacterized protein n=1 Tax=Spinactinospora alkalitolerans TaxID=687207 RepID=A0A852TPX0_9ACTN|nr:hypothetical protein [Spinactinospora alkalitolerans]NYE46008.1 hypothetical protein [Spinactinospora alkalitolerans]